MTHEAFLTLLGVVLGSVITAIFWLRSDRYTEGDVALEGLIRYLEDPDEVWVQGNFTLVNLRLGIGVWMDSGVQGVNVHPNPLKLRRRDRQRLWRALRLAKDNMVRRQHGMVAATVESGDQQWMM